STSALLRPIVQDTLLPTAAYVGGPAEILYLDQLPPLYRAFERVPPLAIPRARFRIVDHKAARLLAQLGLAAGHLERPEAELLARVRCGERPDVEARLLAPFSASLDALAEELGPDPAISRAVGKTRDTVAYAIGKLAANVERASLYADAARVDALRRV